MEAKMTPVVGQTYGKLTAVGPHAGVLWKWECACGDEVIRSTVLVIDEGGERHTMCRWCYAGTGKDIK